MDGKQFFDDLQAKINKVLEDSPAKDIEKNVRALLVQGFSKLDLITREEFDAQTLIVEKLGDRLDVLEERVKKLEEQVNVSQATAAPE